MALRAFVLSFLLFATLGDSVNGVKVQFYGFFTGLVYESNSTEPCNNLPVNKRDVPIRSIKTDTCVMVYYNLNCRSHSKKFNPNKSLGWNYWIRSFHTCNENEGGHKLDLDITEFYDLWRPDEVPRVLESYKDICSCVNIPDYVQKMARWSTNNHGNELLAFYDKNCSQEKWKARVIPAGMWDDSASIYTYKIADWATSTQHKIQSLGPNPNSTYYQISCNKTTNDSQQNDGKFQVVEKEEKYQNYSSQGYKQQEITQRPQKRMDRYFDMQDMAMRQTDLEGIKPKNSEEFFKVADKRDEVPNKNQEVYKKLHTLEAKFGNLQERINDEFIKLRNDIKNLASQV